MSRPNRELTPMEMLALNASREHPSPLVQLAHGLEDIDAEEREIHILRDEIEKMANACHQAYHGAHPPDLNTVGWRECSRNICVRAQQLTDPNRKRGHLSARSSP